MKRFARGALTLAFWVAMWAALALLVNRVVCQSWLTRL